MTMNTPDTEPDLDQPTWRLRPIEQPKRYSEWSETLILLMFSMVFALILLFAGDA